MTLSGLQPLLMQAQPSNMFLPALPWLIAPELLRVKVSVTFYFSTIVTPLINITFYFYAISSYA